MKHLTLLFALLAPTLAHAELGRLFFTPEKRAALTRAATLGVPESQVDTRARVTLNGIVQGPHGRTTLWVNGQSVQGAATAGGMRIEAQDASRATLQPLDTPKGPTRALKVGETLAP